jgi:hypothetical protein
MIGNIARVRGSVCTTIFTETRREGVKALATDQRLIDSQVGLLGLLADFDQVAFSVADFKELHVVPILDSSNENAAIRKMFVCLL